MCTIKGHCHDIRVYCVYTHGGVEVEALLMACELHAWAYR